LFVIFVNIYLWREKEKEKKEEKKNAGTERNTFETTEWLFRMYSADTSMLSHG